MEDAVFDGLYTWWLWTLWSEIESSCHRWITACESLLGLTFTVVQSGPLVVKFADEVHDKSKRNRRLSSLKMSLFEQSIRILSVCVLRILARQEKCMGRHAWLRCRKFSSAVWPNMCARWTTLGGWQVD